MSSHLITGALAAAAILYLPALAIGAPQDPTAPPADEALATGAPNSIPAASAAQGAGLNASGVAMDASQMPPDQAKALQSGDNTLVANAPVPDTPANRAKYGKPLSNGGKRTPPAGN